MPFYVWKEAEGGQVASICTGLTVFSSRDNRRSQAELLKDGFLLFRNRRQHYGALYLLLQTLNLLIILFQAWFWVRFFGQGAHLFGLNYIQYFLQDQNLDGYPIKKPNPAFEFFPSMVKCQLNTVGVGGDIENNDAMCSLSFNGLYIPMFLFLYFWTCFLILATIFGVFSSLFTGLSCVRALILCHGTELNYSRLKHLSKNLRVSSNILRQKLYAWSDMKFGDVFAFFSVF